MVRKKPNGQRPTSGDNENHYRSNKSDCLK
jgi:hypothetical protein